MEENLIQIRQFISEWYKTFGIDYLFFDSTRISSQNQIASATKQTETRTAYRTIEELKQAVYSLNFPLKNISRNTVFSDGDPDADIMIIGEAPGQEEDEQGKPFVGQSGKLLNNMLASVGLDRSNVYITNILFWRPPGNRTPSLDEIAFCLPYVEQHIMLAKPKVLLLLGGVAVKSILNTSESISKLRGAQNTFKGIPTIATFHPAYLLRSPSQKASVFRDLILLKKLVSSQ